jgi:hypothetical protein
MHYLQCRQVTQPYKLLKLFQPYVSAKLVADSQIVGRILVTGVAIESGFASSVTNRILAWYRFTKLAVVPERDALPDCGIPKITGRGLVDIATIVSRAPV